MPGMSGNTGRVEYQRPSVTGTYSDTAGSDKKMGNAQEWNLDIQQETEDTTSFESGGYHEYEITLKNANGSIKSNYDEVASVDLMDAFLKSEKVRFNFYPGNATVSGSRYYQAICILTSMPVSSAATGLAQMSFNVQVTGPVKVKTVAA